MLRLGSFPHEEEVVIDPKEKEADVIKCEEESEAVAQEAKDSKNTPHSTPPQQEKK